MWQMTRKDTKALLLNHPTPQWAWWTCVGKETLTMVTWAEKHRYREETTSLTNSKTIFSRFVLCNDRNIIWLGTMEPLIVLFLKICFEMVGIWRGNAYWFASFHSYGYNLNLLAALLMSGWSFLGTEFGFPRLMIAPASMTWDNYEDVSKVTKINDSHSLQWILFCVLWQETIETYRALYNASALMSTWDPMTKRWTQLATLRITQPQPPSG